MCYITCCRQKGNTSQVDKLLFSVVISAWCRRDCESLERVVLASNLDRLRGLCETCMSLRLRVRLSKPWRRSMRLLRCVEGLRLRLVFVIHCASTAQIVKLL
jgi:hypothetical protein